MDVLELELRGASHAYERMVGVAFEIGSSKVKEIANDLTQEARAYCMGMALADIDTCAIENKASWPYKIIVTVLNEIKSDRQRKGLR